MIAGQKASPLSPAPQRCWLNFLKTFDLDYEDFRLVRACAVASNSEFPCPSKRGTNSSASAGAVWESRSITATVTRVQHLIKDRRQILPF
jgi:hypothetical protein